MKNKFTKAALTSDNLFQYTTGKEGARELGYDTSSLNIFSKEQMVSFCGVGNPFSDDLIKRGSTVLDYGCGSGVDLIIAGRLTGETGKAFGVDITSTMLTKAERLIAETSSNNCSVQLTYSEKLPFEESSFDTIISNGVFNLSPDKTSLFGELFRVLKPDGKLQFADIVLEKEIPARHKNVDDWSD